MTFYRDIDFADQGMGCHFFHFLDEKSPARVAKVPAAILNPEHVLR